MPIIKKYIKPNIIGIKICYFDYLFTKSLVNYLNNLLRVEILDLKKKCILMILKHLKIINSLSNNRKRQNLAH